MDTRDVEILERRAAYEGYFRVRRYRLRHRRFAGDWTGVMTREVFERGHAVAVLPYDPRRDAVVLIEQFRIGALAAGWAPWMLEVVAGIIEDGETPEAVARREALEEAGCRLGRLRAVTTYLVSPGGTSESCAVYCGEADTAGLDGGLHGLAEEHEDIRVRVVPADEAFAMTTDGRIANAAALIALQWLALQRDRLRREWSDARSG